jgi:hypothetical protein
LFSPRSRDHENAYYVVTRTAADGALENSFLILKIPQQCCHSAVARALVEQAELGKKNQPGFDKAGIHFSVTALAEGTGGRRRSCRC